MRATVIFPNSWFSSNDLRWLLWEHQRAGRSSVVLRLDKLPVDNLPDSSEVVRALVAVVDVVGVLPDIYGKKWLEAVLNRRAGVVHSEHFELAGFANKQPGPATAKMFAGHLTKLSLEGGEICKSFVDGLSKLARWRIALALRRGQALPIKAMIISLGGVIENWAGLGLNNDLFNWQLGKICALDKTIEIINVGLVVLAVVELNSFLRHYWL